MEFTVPSIVALRIAGLDRAKFNNMVNSGFYPCTPATSKGADRMFSVHDVISLVTLSRMLDLGVLPRHAGPFACFGLDGAELWPDVFRVTITRYADGTHTEIVNGKPTGQGDGAGVRIVLEVAEIRGYVLGEIAKISREHMEQLNEVSQIVARGDALE